MQPAMADEVSDRPARPRVPAWSGPHASLTLGGGMTSRPASSCIMAAMVRTGVWQDLGPGAGRPFSSPPESSPWAWIGVRGKERPSRSKSDAALLRA